MPPARAMKPAVNIATEPLPVLRTALRLLTFRASHDELLGLDRRHLAFGLAMTWLVGMGRYWDDPGAHLLQHLGVGSVVYVFAISLFLWLLIWPLAPEGWSYTRLLTFVTLVSPPAALYAIPVERFVTLSTAQSVNVWFLAVVAVWRVALLFFYLFRLARLRWYQVIVAALLPLTVIVASLTALNLERAVFHIMSGMDVHGTASDAAYRVLLGLTMLSVWAFVPLLVAYLVMVVIAQLRRRRARAASAVPAVVEGAPSVE